MVAYKIERPPVFTGLAPRVRFRHYNVIESGDVLGLTTPWVISGSSGLWLQPLCLRKPDFQSAGGAFPENFVRMARYYGSYRVIGFHLFLSYHALNTAAPETWKFYSCVYAVSSTDEVNDPYNTSTVTTVEAKNALLQNNDIRKKVIQNPILGNGKDANCHDAGWFSISGIEQLEQNDMTDSSYAGSVDIAGEAVQDPLATPSVFVKVVPVHGAFTANYTPQVQAHLTFDVEWYNLRQDIEEARIDPE